MSAFSPPPVEDCLDVAVDHRLRVLFKPTCKQPRTNIGNSHAVLLAELGRASIHRKISEPEVNVTQQFAGPGYTGGICFLLLQPSNYHPYWKGQDTVILYCRTLTVLDEGLRAVTCGSMGLGSPAVSLIDSAPYIRPNDRVSDEYKYNMRQSTIRVIREKKPDVVVCMWKDTGRQPLEMGKVQSLGVGQDFDESRITFGGVLGVPMERVNSFHPSYAANYNPHVSCFRQLMLLNIAQARYIYEYGTWREEEWMKELKGRCKTRAKDIAGTDTSNRQYIDHHLNVQLDRIQMFVTSVISDDGVARSDYGSILDSGVTEHFNDASLCLRLLHNLHVRPEDIDPEDVSIISSGRKSCLQLLRKVIYKFSDRKTMRKSNYVGYFKPIDIANSLRNCNMTGSDRISAIITVFLQRLNVAFEVKKSENDTEYEVDLEQLSQLFLSTAVLIEKLLSYLAETRSNSGLGSLEEGIANLQV